MPRPIQMVLLPVLVCLCAVVAALLTDDSFVAIYGAAGVGVAIWAFITPLGAERDD